MLITVSRSGGFAGLTRRAQVDVDAAPDAAWWRTAAAGATPLPPPAPTPSSPVRDGFTWTIEVGAERAVLPDSAVRGPCGRSPSAPWPRAGRRGDRRSGRRSHRRGGRPRGRSGPR